MITAATRQKSIRVANRLALEWVPKLHKFVLQQHTVTCPLIASIYSHLFAEHSDVLALAERIAVAGARKTPILPCDSALAFY